MKTLTEQQEATIQTWIDTLNSGSIQQAHGALENEAGEMCCLGVLMQCQGRPAWDYYDGNQDDLERSDLPGGYGAGLHESVMNALAHLNDGTAGLALAGKTFNPYSKRLSFKEIAAIIPRIKHCTSVAEVMEALPEFVSDDLE